MTDSTNDAASGPNPFFPPSNGRCMINDLPTELLSYIFVLGQPTYELNDDSDDEDEDEDEDEESEDERTEEEKEQDRLRSMVWEVSVSHVCRLWRTVALASPTLWSTVEFSSFDTPTDIARAQTYLERAANVPLNIGVDLTKPDADDLESDDELAMLEDAARDAHLTRRMVELLPLITPRAAHWRQLEIMVSDYHLMHIALSQLGALPGAPQLEALRLYVYEDTDEYEVFEPALLRAQNFVLFSGHAPRLVDVALWGVHLDWERSAFLSGLQELELAYHAKDVRPSFRHVARILRSSPALHTLSFCASGPSGGPADWTASMADEEDVSADADADVTTLALPSVKELVLSYLEADYAQALAEQLVLPGLTALALDLEADDFSAFVRSLARPARSTGKALLTQLEAVKVSGLPCSDAAVAEALGALSNARSVNLNFGYVEEAWLRYLVEPPKVAAASTSATGRRVFCPKMETLTSTGLDGEDMITLVKARKEAGVPLKRLLMDEDDPVDRDQDEWLSQNVETYETFVGSDEEDISSEAISDVFDEVFGNALEDLEEEQDGDQDEWEDVD